MSKKVYIQGKIKKVPQQIERFFDLFLHHLRKTAGKPYNCGWKNVGPLKQCGSNVYHCHITRSYVAVWEVTETDTTVVCRITYIGTREKAPY